VDWQLWNNLPKHFTVLLSFLQTEQSQISFSMRFLIRNLTVCWSFCDLKQLQTSWHFINIFPRTILNVTNSASLVKRIPIWVCTVGKYSRYSIVWILITLIPEIQNYDFINFLTHVMDVGAIFTSPYHRKCERMLWVCKK